MKLVAVPFCTTLALALAGCTATGERPSPEPLQQADFNWRQIATLHDRWRVRQWRPAWIEGLEKARASGHAAALDAEGALLDPDAALPYDPPPAGDYACRVIKVGAKSEGLLDYVSYPAFACRIRLENGLLSFTKLTGSQRPRGLIVPDNNRRAIFLGTLQLGDEKLSLQYGRDQERDMVGLVEKIDESRWRIVFPYPHFESTVDVLELVPQS